MRDRSIVGVVFFVKFVFLEKRNDRTSFELIRKGTRDKRKVSDVSQGRYRSADKHCLKRDRNGINIRERVR